MPLVIGICQRLTRLVISGTTADNVTFPAITR